MGVDWLSASGGVAVSNITNVSVSHKRIQRNDTDISITASATGTVTDWFWALRASGSNGIPGDIVDMSFQQNPVFDAISEPGYYDILLIARNTVDEYRQTFRRAFFNWYPRFTEGEADEVIDAAGGDYFFDGAMADLSGHKFFIKGTGTLKVHILDTRGTAGWANHIRIQSDGATVINGSTGGNGSAFRLEGDESDSDGGCRYIVVDGYNTNGERGGLRINSHATSAVQNIRVLGGRFTDIHFLGIDSYHTRAVNAANISMVPTANANTNSENWTDDNSSIFDCGIYNGGDEGIYDGYFQDDDQAGFSPPKGRNHVYARNTIHVCGRDGIQPSGQIGLECHDNDIEDVGQNPEGSEDNHRSFISWNPGTAGYCYNNTGRGGEMFLNIQSGLFPYDVLGGETSPRNSYFFHNYFDTRGYTPAGGASVLQPVAIYMQSKQDSGAGNLSFIFSHNTFVVEDRPLSECHSHTNSFTLSIVMVNNIIIQVGDAGDFDEINLVGGGATPSTTLNNLKRQYGSTTDLLFTDFDNFDVSLSSFDSVAYAGSPTTITSSHIPTALQNDLLGYPLKTTLYPYTFGAYSGTQKRAVTAQGDQDAPTFTTPLALTPTLSGAEIDLNTNKVACIVWAVTANGGEVPTDDELDLGSGFLAAGRIMDTGSAPEDTITGLNGGTAYDFHYLSITENGIVTRHDKIDFSTSADAVAPTASGWAIADNDRDHITATLSENGCVYNGNSGWTVSGSHTVTGGSIVGTLLTLTVSPAFDQEDFGESFTISYTESGTPAIEDAAGNDLADFGATAITNNIAAETWENVIWQNVVNATATGEDLDATSATATAVSTQVIPASYKGFVAFRQSAEARSADFGSVFGLTDSANTAPTRAQILMSRVLQHANLNVDNYEGSTYRDTTSNNQATNTWHIVEFDPADNKTRIYTVVSASFTTAGWTLRRTHTSTVTTNAKRAAWRCENIVNGHGVRDCIIQCDKGLI
jgi:hypothetical protein